MLFESHGLMGGLHHHADNLPFDRVDANLLDAIVPVGWHKIDLATFLILVVILHGDLVIDISDDNLATDGDARWVDHQNIIGEDSSIDHRVTCGTDRTARGF